MRNNVESYLTKNFENPDVQKSITALREQVKMYLSIHCLNVSSANCNLVINDGEN